MHHVAWIILGRTCVWLALQPPSAPPGAAPEDSVRAAAEDSLRAAAAIAPESALTDSLTAAADSLVAAPGDSLTVTPDSTQAALPDLIRAQLPPWSATARRGDRELHETHPMLLAEALEPDPDVALRVGGEWGAPAFLSIGPLGGPAPEIEYDGVPSRSPADLDPAVWDRSVVSVASLGVADAHAPPGGEPRLLAEVLPPLSGRTHLRTHFSRQAHESYQRGIWLTTPMSTRGLRLEFEEWKTEDGRNFTLNPQFDPLPDDFGRSKMRRFRASGEASTRAGRVLLSFGRGRRLMRGTVLQTGDTERWTGEVSLGLDRPTATGHWRVRAYHLDFSDDDRGHAESRDAARLGIRLQHVPIAAGWGANFEVERWTAAFVSASDRRRPRPAYVARAASSRRTGLGAGLAAVIFGEGAYAEHASAHFDGAGGATLEKSLTTTGTLELVAERRLRVPTLLETDGLSTTDAADGSVLRRAGAGPLPMERQDHAQASLTFRGERWSLAGRVETWRLTRGIGWEPRDGAAITVGDLELSLHQVGGSASLRGGSARLGWDLQTSGQHVLGPLGHARDRGAGWPLWAARARARGWTQVASRTNRAFVEIFVISVGPRFDDVQAPIRGTRLAAQSRVDAKIGLKIRDAEIYAAWTNLLDTELVEVSGTRRRPRELRLGLFWPFFN